MCPIFIILNLEVQKQKKKNGEKINNVAKNKSSGYKKKIKSGEKNKIPRGNPAIPFNWKKSL